MSPLDPEHREQEPAERTLQGLRILVVEDWLPLAREMRHRLESVGAEVVGPAGRVNHALDLAGRSELNGAVLDIDLHGERVFPVARVLQERGIPFIFVSGFEDIEVPEDLKSAPFFNKPVRFDNLHERIRECFA